MLRSGKGAPPLTAAWVFVPDNTPPPGLVLIATVTLLAKLVAVLPKLSLAVTCTAGAMTAPADAPLGRTVDVSTFAARGVTLNAALSGPVRPVVAAVSV